MYKHKLENTKVSTENAEKLQTALLRYHEFRHTFQTHPLKEKIAALATWQSARLQETHKDLHSHPDYQQGLDFLLEDLYSPKDFSQRDNDIDRIFPKMVKLLPDSILYTVANLVELNYTTQHLDLTLTETLVNTLKANEITEENYAEAYRVCNNKQERLHQIQLITNIGDDLDRYVHSKFLYGTLRITRKPAEMAGIGALHDFLLRGFKSFKSMNRVDKLLEQLVVRETQLLNNIFDGAVRPFSDYAPKIKKADQSSVAVFN